MNQTQVTQRNDSRTKETYEKWADGCHMYHPCPINYKCMNKATHLYKKCESCKVPHATHNHKNRAWAIRRDNFAITVTPETFKEFEKLSEELEDQS